MRSRLALAALLLSTPLVHGGCASRSSGLPNAPIFNTGASATIIPPGASAPAMPGYGQQRSSSGGPGQSGSQSGSSSGIPGMGSPPPGWNTPPGQPQGYPQAQSAPETQMLGGAVTIDTRQVRQKADPLWSNPLFWPFAVVAYPFVKLERTVNAGKDEAFRQHAYERIQEQTGVPMPDGSPYGARQQSQMAAEQAQQQAMEQQLRQQQAGQGSEGAPAGAAYVSAAPRPSLSIADELAALRGGGSAGDSGDSGVAAPRSAAPSPGAAAADEAEDRDGDGQADRWVYASDGRKRELLDEDQDGRPEKTVHYEADGETIARIDEDTDGDGEVDSWSTHQEGVLARRRADTNGDGEPDTIDYYDRGDIVRRTEDKDGDGRPERITHFDDKGRPSSLEEDTDGDGLVDTRSHYAGGKLVRRELLDEARAAR